MLGGYCIHTIRFYRDYQITPKGTLFNLIIIIMDKNGKNEELQSRRQFFKKAAKGALPILGAIALSSIPSLSKAEEEVNCSCAGTCSGTCKGTCREGCQSTCYDQCYNACKGTCKGTCRGGCSSTCSGR